MKKIFFGSGFGSGTREWAAVNFNFLKGCRNNCRYCYAKKMAARFGRIKNGEEWKNPVLRNSVTIPKGKTVMFPSSHDLFPEHLDIIVKYLRRILDAGNRILIVSKPRFDVIPHIADEFIISARRIEFRFTIGTDEDETMKFWEPNAPSYKERKMCVKYTSICGYRTSVSMEPLLTETPENVINDLKKWACEFWLGKMNHVSLNLEGEAETDSLTATIYLRQKRINSDEFWVSLADRLGRIGLIEYVKWKDSVRPIIESCRNKKETNGKKRKKARQVKLL